jgi:lipopolysaccharide transport system permease protein
VLVLLAATVFGLALAVSSLSVHFGDVRDLVGNVLTLAFFLTPVLYPAASVPERFRPLLWANPFASFLAAVHESAFFFRPVSAALWGAMAAAAVVSLLVGGFVFDRLRDSIAEEA